MKKIAILVLCVFAITACNRTAGLFDSFAQCLTDKGIVMYSTETCPNCVAQKEDFKGSFDLITNIDCELQGAKCAEAEITGVPTWDIEGKMHTGKKSLSELAELSACSLTE